MENKIPGEIDAKTATAIINVMPIGTIMPFAGNADRAEELNAHGWFLCNGFKLNQHNYPRLFQILKNSCGGDAPDFCLPDLRGVFLRAVDVGKDEKGTHRDPDADTRTSHIGDSVVGNQVLSRQADAFKNHKHTTPYGSVYVDVAGARNGNNLPFEKFERPKDGKVISTADEGGRDTRPVNVSVNYIIFAGLPQ